MMWARVAALTFVKVVDVAVLDTLLATAVGAALGKVRKPENCLPNMPEMEAPADGATNCFMLWKGRLRREFNRLV
jgi:hypothetical protein